MKAQRPTRHVDFVYREAPSYQRHFANGVFAGPTARGDFRLDFFFECMRRPEVTRAEITETGLRAETVVSPPKQEIVREVVTGVVMSLDQVRNMVAFLSEGLAKLDAAAKPAK